jgi:hypothetical protein
MKNLTRVALISALAFVCGCAGAQQAPPEPAVPSDDETIENVVEIPVHAEATVFIMCLCPHSADLMRTLVELKKEMGYSLQLSIGYLGVLDENGDLDPGMGQAEIEAAKVQTCVGMKMGDEPWIDFLECLYDSDRWRAMPSGWRECAEACDVDEDVVNECLESGEGAAVLAQAYGVSTASGILASPALIIDGHLYLGVRSKEALLRYLCYEAGKPETRPPLCGGVEPPAPIGAMLLFDSRCQDASMCDVYKERGLVERLIPGLQISEVDFDTKEGRHLYDLIQKTGAGIVELPLLILDNEIDPTGELSEQLSQYLIPFGKGYMIAMGNGWNPLAEICDNGEDDTLDGKIDCEDPACSEKLSCRKEEKRRLDLFIMSGCPFAAKVLPEVDHVLDHFENDRKSIEFSLQFVGDVEGDKLSSMHGEEEIKENLRMICAQKLYARKYRFMEYVKCRTDTFDSPAWEPCVPKGMDKKLLERCAEGRQGFELLKKSFELSNRLGIRGSPSWLLNNRLAMEGRTAKEIIEGFCEHNDEAACKKELVEYRESARSTTSDQCR